MKTAKLSIRTKRQRAALAPRAAPYFEVLGPGRALGYRAGANTWTARWKDRDGKQWYEVLDCGDDFDAAADAARRWFDVMSGAAVAKPKRGTVRHALDAYLASLREKGRADAASWAGAFFKRSIDGDPIASIELETLQQEQFREWRDRLRDGRPPKRGKDRKAQPRGPQSINRIVRAVAAGLTYAVRHGHVGNPAAWTVDALHVPKRSSHSRTAPRNLLTPEQREMIKAECSPIVREFLRGLELTGARPNEVADLTAEKFDARAGALLIGSWKGNPVQWRERSVPLSSVGVAFFAERSRQYPTGALFPGAKGGHMPRRYWAAALRLAKRMINKKAESGSRLQSLVAYSFRHARISELLQVAKLDVATVASITGTSVQMIEDTYFHQIPRAIKPSLDLVDSQS